MGHRPPPALAAPPLAAAPTRRGVLVAGGMAALALLLPGCAGLQPERITLTPQELQLALARSFPLDRRVLEVLDVTLALPRLSLRPERNRIGAAFDIRARDRLFGTAWNGLLALESGLRVDPGLTLRLDGVQVDELRLDGGSGSAGGSAGVSRGLLDRLAATLVEQVLDGMALWQPSPERAAQLARLGLAPGPVTVGARGIEVALKPRG